VGTSEGGESTSVADPELVGGAELSPRARQDFTWRGYVNQSAKGDQSALASLYDESSSLVYSVALRVLGDVADAEEVTLDVYTQVWKTAATYDGSRGSVTAWLVTLARSRAIDRCRARTSRQSRETALPETFDFPSPGPTPERETVEAQRRLRIAAAMAALPSEQREVLQLAFFSGLTHSELAERLQQPLGTVKTRIRMGMMKLREQLEPLAV
jgi:RNA polymerase sigma-70 factor (ECF subfamily)